MPHTAQKVPTQRKSRYKEAATDTGDHRFLVPAGRVTSTCPFFPTTERSLSQRKVSVKDLLFANTLDFEIRSSFFMEHFFKKSL